MANKLQPFFSEVQQLVDEKFDSCFEQAGIPQKLKDSMLYSLKAGGKRLRPILVCASYFAYAKDVNKVISTAAALEMLHTYSLIHDDLPAMDDDDYRRGKLTNHKMFDEATAILAGDALLTNSFGLIANDGQLTAEEKVEILGLLSLCSGPAGMVAGQFLDMEAEDKKSTLQQLEQIHSLKTGELIRFAVYAGAYLGNANETQLTYLNKFAYQLGLLFQVQDDILDVVGDAGKLGKSVGSDEGNLKSTYPKLLGIDGAIAKKRNLRSICQGAIEKSRCRSVIFAAFGRLFQPA
ncbi:polyprenyl synthetase family protein [Virgibacillus halophilus]|uniref:Polyprenyl synthetase family protein n=1 Tax=Tigheibacillus halophilus TaxID=361280 RepID=A0ABU5CAV8_9BACI|nr:polyprenyl synthetase family protein [Virgibacillus halophilus]